MLNCEYASRPLHSLRSLCDFKILRYESHFEHCKILFGHLLVFNTVRSYCKKSCLAISGCKYRCWSCQFNSSFKNLNAAHYPDTIMLHCIPLLAKQNKTTWCKMCPSTLYYWLIVQYQKGGKTFVFLFLQKNIRIYNLKSQRTKNTQNRIQKWLCWMLDNMGVSRRVYRHDKRCYQTYHCTGWKISSSSSPSSSSSSLPCLFLSPFHVVVVCLLYSYVTALAQQPLAAGLYITEPFLKNSHTCLGKLLSLTQAGRNAPI